MTGQKIRPDSLWGLRGLFGSVVIAGYKPSTWTMIVGGTNVPPEPAVTGRMYLVQRGRHREIQVPCCDATPGHGDQNDLLWRQYALAGRPGPGVTGDQRDDQPEPGAYFGDYHDAAGPGADMPVLDRYLIGEPEAAAYLNVRTNAIGLGPQAVRAGDGGVLRAGHPAP